MGTAALLLLLGGMLMMMAPLVELPRLPDAFGVSQALRRAFHMPEQPAPDDMLIELEKLK